MDGLHIIKEDDNLNKTTDYKTSTSLLASGDKVDVMLIDVLPGVPACIDPGEDESLMEFFYVIEGMAILHAADENIAIYKGDSFYTDHLTESILVQSDQGVKLLYVSSQPIFKMLSEYNKDLEALLRASEKKDFYTHNHAERVQTYSIKICEKLKMSKHIIYTLSVSSLFHDIGKCVIPDEILNKPGKLTDNEYNVIKTHPTESSRLLKGRFDDVIFKIVQQHHERLDGSGYPCGLKGDEIIFEALIIAVADTYDAITSDRAYRKGMSSDIAMAELWRFTPAHYDAVVVQALQDVLIDEGLLNL